MQQPAGPLYQGAAAQAAQKRRAHLRPGSRFMASRLTLASSSLCPPLRKTTPATAGGTVRCSARTVAAATSALLAGVASMPDQADGPAMSAMREAAWRSMCAHMSKAVVWFKALPPTQHLGSATFRGAGIHPHLAWRTVLLSVRSSGAGHGEGPGPVAAPAETMLGLSSVPSSSTLWSFSACAPACASVDDTSEVQEVAQHALGDG